MFQQGGFGPIPGQVHHFLTVEKEEDTVVTDSSATRRKPGDCTA